MKLASEKWVFIVIPLIMALIMTVVYIIFRDTSPSGVAEASATQGEVSDITTPSTPHMLTPNMGNQLDARIRAFETAYFSRFPDDTDLSYQERLRPFITETGWSDWPAFQAWNSYTAQLRDQNVSFEVEVPTYGIVVNYYTSEYELALVNVLVRVSYRDRDGNLVNQENLDLTREWRYVDSDWFVYPYLPE